MKTTGYKSHHRKHYPGPIFFCCLILLSLLVALGLYWLEKF